MTGENRQGNHSSSGRKSVLLTTVCCTAVRETLLMYVYHLDVGQLTYCHDLFIRLNVVKNQSGPTLAKEQTLMLRHLHSPDFPFLAAAFPQYSILPNFILSRKPPLRTFDIDNRPCLLSSQSLSPHTLSTSGTHLLAMIALCQRP